MKKISLVHFLRKKFISQIFLLYLATLSVGFVFHLGLIRYFQIEKEAEIKSSIIESIQEPLRKNALIDIKNIITGNSITHPSIQICIKLKNGTALTEDKCDSAQYERASVPLLDDYFFISVVSEFPWALSFSYLFLLGISTILFLLTKNRFKYMTDAIIREVEMIGEKSAEDQFQFSELEEVAGKVKAARTAIIETEKFKRKVELGKIASQVAHDIRGPLGVIRHLEAEIVEKMSEKKSLLFLNAVKQAEELAKGLMQEHRISKREGSFIRESKTFSDPVKTIRECVDAFKAINAMQIGEISLENGLPKSNVVLSSLEELSLRRVVNNLLQNAIEAMATREGKIVVKVGLEGKMLIVTVADQGKGIPRFLIERIFEDSFSHGKKDGTGLGLSIVAEILKANGGSIEVESVENQGSRFTFKIPVEVKLVAAPVSVNLFDYQNIIVVDDESIFHAAWDDKLVKAGFKGEIIHCYHELELAQNLSLQGKCLYLIDYNFIGQELNGVELILKYNLQADCILVTSMAFDPSLIRKCESLGIRLLDKQNLNQFCQSSKSVHALVLIDDGKLTRMGWQLAAEENEITFKAYSDFESLLANIEFHSKDDVFYCDHKISGKMDGLNGTKKLSELGFKKIYLQTGSIENFDLSTLPWINGIVGKEFPKTAM